MKESNEDTEWEPDINWVKLAQQTGCEARSLAEACSLPVGLCKEVFCVRPEYILKSAISERH